MAGDGEVVEVHKWSSLLRVVASLLLGYALLMVGNALSNTQTSLALLQQGVPVTVAGLVQSAYYAGFFIGGFFCSAIVHRYGHHRAFAALAAVICIVVLAQALVHSPLLWALVRFVNGLAIVGIFMVVESWLNGCVGNAQRGQLFSLYMMVSYLGASAGQWLLKLPLTQPGWPFIVVAMLFALAIIPVTLTSQRPLTLVAAPAGSVVLRTLRTVGELRRLAPLALYGVLIAGCFNSAFYSMLPVVLSQLSYLPHQIGNFMGLALLAAPLLQWPMGKWADRSDRCLLLSRTALTVVVASLLLTQLLDTVLLLPLALVYVCVAFTFYGTLSGVANDAMPAERRVETSAALLTLYALGGTLGPLLCSLAMGALGAAGYFAISTAMAAALLGLAVWTLQQRQGRLPFIDYLRRIGARL
ncbi:MFS transporter [Chromobacterium phragmitis]|uniref:MFS transporter n=1 Tax=Chromobacterium amazonense TaxID=1382803 RepID=UPI0021B71411|nr:MFS transporter [Chromobacterium amazonense]MBM2882960.1 MFS transporter [Chromobacterium amazonense]MDE1716000.1 MFS transporter [Chromobacterium amazonense]